MSFPNFPISGRAIMIPGPSPYSPVEALRRRKAAITRLTTALHEYLTLDIDAAIEQAMAPAPQPPPPSIDDLETAQRGVEQVQSQIDALTTLCADLPETNATYLREFQLKPLEQQLQWASGWVSQIQTAMESATAQNSGSSDERLFNGEVYCARCGKTFKMPQGLTIPQLKEHLLAEGWGRDQDGDHICPSCTAAQVQEPGPPTSKENL